MLVLALISKLATFGREKELTHSARFDLVEELYSVPQKPPSTMHTFAAWLEDWVTKLVAADEISAYVEPSKSHGCSFESFSCRKTPSSIGHFVHDRMGCDLSRVWS